MVKLEFKELSFFSGNKGIRIDFLKYFYFYVDKDKLEKISSFNIGRNHINFKNINEKSARNKFNIILENGFKNLRSKLTNKKTIYIHRNSGIPLIGNNSFGIIDRDTNLIEVKPITGCNLNCIYCSVDQDKREFEFIVEKDYLIEELKKVIEFKQTDIEVHIASQGEPLFYASLIDLIKDISTIKRVKTISMDTNGTILSNKYIDELVNAGLTRFNLSINSLNKENAKKIAGASYNIDKIKKLALYISKKCDLLIAPVLVSDVNDEDIEDIIIFYKSIKAKYSKFIGIQNFLEYRYGRNPVKALSMDKFYNKLASWEEKYKISLRMDALFFNIKKTKSLPKPFKKGDVINAEVVYEGRFKDEKIAVSENRNITLPKCYKTKRVRVKITRSKHNIYFARVL